MYDRGGMTLAFFSVYDIMESANPNLQVTENFEFSVACKE